MAPHHAAPSQIKCTHYWPLEPGNAFTFDTLRVTLVSEEKTFENRLVERTLELHHPDTVPLSGPPPPNQKRVRAECYQLLPC
jgi:hypothetical protein